MSLSSSVLNLNSVASSVIPKSSTIVYSTNLPTTSTIVSSSQNNNANTGNLSNGSSVGSSNSTTSQGVFNGITSGVPSQGFPVTFYGSGNQNFSWTSAGQLNVGDLSFKNNSISSPTKGEIQLDAQVDFSFENVIVDDETEGDMELDSGKYISKLFVRVPMCNLILNAGTHDGQLKIITLNEYIPSSNSSCVTIDGSFLFVNGRKDTLIMRQVGSSTTLNWSTQTLAWHGCNTGTF